MISVNITKYTCYNKKWNKGGKFQYRNKKKKKQGKQQNVTIALFTFNENPWAGFLSSMHFWLSFWLRFFFADCRFVKNIKNLKKRFLVETEIMMDGVWTKNWEKCYVKEVGNGVRTNKNTLARTTRRTRLSRRTNPRWLYLHFRRRCCTRVGVCKLRTHAR